jgi:hypothetical protein
LRGSGKPRQEKPVYRKFRVSLRLNNWALINTKEKEMTAHKHAENMRLFAEDALQSKTPWLHWQCRAVGDIEWTNFDGGCPVWRDDVEYRRKPKTIRIGERDVPAPMRVAPAHGSTYWYPNPSNGELFNQTEWVGHNDLDVRRLKHGLVHATKKAAIAHAEALILVSGGSL